jgi:hypothetical protein
MNRLKSILNWELWNQLRSRGFKIETEYIHKKRKKMSEKTIEVCLGVGMNQLFPEYTEIRITKPASPSLIKNMSDSEKNYAKSKANKEETEISKESK